MMSESAATAREDYPDQAPPLNGVALSDIGPPSCFLLMFDGFAF